MQNGMPTMMDGPCANISSMDMSDTMFYTILANGRGWVSDPLSRKPSGKAEVLAVKKGLTYRVRVIGGE